MHFKKGTFANIFVTIALPENFGFLSIKFRTDNGLCHQIMHYSIRLGACAKLVLLLWIFSGTEEGVMVTLLQDSPKDSKSRRLTQVPASCLLSCSQQRFPFSAIQHLDVSSIRLLTTAERRAAGTVENKIYPELPNYAKLSLKYQMKRISKST